MRGREIFATFQSKPFRCEMTNMKCAMYGKTVWDSEKNPRDI